MPKKEANDFTKDCVAPGCMNERIPGENYCIGHCGEMTTCKRCDKLAIFRGYCDDHKPKKARRICLKPGCTSMARKGTYCYRHRDRSMCKHSGCYKTIEPWTELCKEHLKGPKPKIALCRAPKGGYVLKEKKANSCKLNNCTANKRIKGFCQKHATELGYMCEKPQCQRAKIEYSQFCSKHGEVERRIID